MTGRRVVDSGVLVAVDPRGLVYRTSDADWPYEMRRPISGDLINRYNGIPHGCIQLVHTVITAAELVELPLGTVIRQHHVFDSVLERWPASEAYSGEWFAPGASKGYPTAAVALPALILWLPKNGA